MENIWTTYFFQFLDQNFGPREIEKCQHENVLILSHIRVSFLKTKIFNHCLLLVVKLPGGKIILLLVAKLENYSLRNFLLLKFTHYLMWNGRVTDFT